MKFLITGGAGFIGSAVIRNLIFNTKHNVLNIDKLTYASNLNSLESVNNSDRYIFKQVDICRVDQVKEIFGAYKPDVIMHLAAESHVDRSIDNPKEFLDTNIYGTYVLLEETRNIFSKGKKVLFHHVSTDEVYGDLHDIEDAFSETSSYEPSSPYSATKAASDHLVRAWGRTFDLPFVITNCSNNFGPYQFPEKLIPNTILKALSGDNIPIYGDGLQIRDWLFVDDHADALIKVALSGINNETYNIGTNNQMTNLSLVNKICEIMDVIAPKKDFNLNSYSDLIVFVKDRPGHDRHYAIDASKIANEIGWESQNSFQEALSETVKWYLNNLDWVTGILDGKSSLNRIGIIK